MMNTFAGIDLFEESGFGRFDPTDWGLTINIDAALRHPDFVRLGTLMLSSLHFEPGDEHRDYVAGKNQEDAAFAATCFTTFAHEARHFHDLLATPYGAILGRLFTRAEFLHALLWDELLFRSHGVVVPLNDWILNETQFRRAHPELPAPSPLVRQVASAYTEIKQKLAAVNAGLVADTTSMRLPKATGILEGSATIAQQLAIAQWFGVRESENFSRGILARPSSEMYFGTLDLIQRVAGDPVPLTVASFLCLASLYGDALHPDPERSRCPTDMLLELLAWLSERGISLPRIRSFEGIHEPVTEYFLNHHGRDLIGMVQSSTAANQGMYESLQNALEQMEERQERSLTLPRGVLSAYGCLAEAQRIFSNSVVRYPSDYCGEGYRSNLYQLPKPVIRISSSIGLPVDSEIDRWYKVIDEDRLNISAETRDHLHELNGLNLNDSQKAWLANAPVGDDGRIVLRNAYVLQPRAELLRDSPGVLTLDAWRSRVTAPALRLFFESPNRVPRRELAQVLAALRFTGTMLYSEEELPAVNVDDFDVGDPDPEGWIAMLRDIKARRASGQE